MYYEMSRVKKQLSGIRSIINTLAVNQVVFFILEVCKNHYERENISVGNNEQHGDAIFEFMQDRLGKTYLCWIW